jgi:hypothetical protein
MGTPESEMLLRRAMAAVNAGDLVQGRAMLEKILENDARNDWAWIWLSGCVEGALQRRVCLQQALKINPENQAALDGMKVLDGELVQVAAAPPSLLESRLAAIGMGEFGVGAPPVTNAGDSGAYSTGVATAEDPARSEDVAPASPPRQRGLVVLLILCILLLAVSVCGVVVWRVVLPNMGTF